MTTVRSTDDRYIIDRRPGGKDAPRKVSATKTNKGRGSTKRK